MTNEKVIALQDSIIKKCGKLYKHFIKLHGTQNIIYFQHDETGETVVFTPWMRNGKEIIQKMDLHKF